MKKVEKKISSAELEQFLHFRKRAFTVPHKKGKGSYDRKKFKKGLDNQD